MFTTKPTPPDYHLPTYLDWMSRNDLLSLLPPRGGWQRPLTFRSLWKFAFALWRGRPVCGYYDPRLPADEVLLTPDGHYRLLAGSETLLFASALDALRCLIVEYGADPLTLEVK